MPKPRSSGICDVCLCASAACQRSQPGCPSSSWSTSNGLPVPPLMNVRSVPATCTMLSLHACALPVICLTTSWWSVMLRVPPLLIPVYAQTHSYSRQLDVSSWVFDHLWAEGESHYPAILSA